jgi:hypothetical protein
MTAHLPRRLAGSCVALLRRRRCSARGWWPSLLDRGLRAGRC